MGNESPDQRLGAELGTAAALKWCIAYLIADRARRESDPHAFVAALLESGRQYHALVDSTSEADPLGAPLNQALAASWEAAHLTLSEIQREAAFLLDAWPPGSPLRQRGD